MFSCFDQGGISSLCAVISVKELFSNQSKDNVQSEERKILLRVNETYSIRKTTKLTKARENAGDRVVICFSFTFDWLIKRVARVFWTNNRAK